MLKRTEIWMQRRKSADWGEQRVKRIRGNLPLKPLPEDGKQRGWTTVKSEWRRMPSYSLFWRSERYLDHTNDKRVQRWKQPSHSANIECGVQQWSKRWNEARSLSNLGPLIREQCYCTSTWKVMNNRMKLPGRPANCTGKRRTLQDSNNNWYRLMRGPWQTRGLQMVNSEKENIFLKT